MSHGKLRSDKECENCGYTVEVAYCTKCGQHNVQTRQTFPKLVGHFAEDLTHYDTAFWRSIRDLLFKPAKLTRTYLEGRRQQYVPPVKLYIFISFVTFLLIALIPHNGDEEHVDSSTIGSHSQEVTTTTFVNDTINGEIITRPVTKKETNDENYISLGDKDYRNQAELDKDYEEGKLSFLLYHLGSSLVNVKDKTSITVEEALTHALPKAIFLYMPVFTFWLWLFHGKKRWYFFDHGIFTLHYFAFLLLLALFDSIVAFLSEKTFNSDTAEQISGWFTFIIFCYSFFYFFRSHRRMYGETRTISRLKSMTLFIINLISISIASLILVYFTFRNMH